MSEFHWNEHICVVLAVRFLSFAILNRNFRQKNFEPELNKDFET